MDLYQISNYLEILATGAGDGNRTHVYSLEGCHSTVELHLRVNYFIITYFYSQEIFFKKVTLWQKVKKAVQNHLTLKQNR